MPDQIQNSPTLRPAALTAFVHGIEPRAWVFALSQCGDADTALRVLEATLRDFAAAAQTLPLAHWPLQFWTSLLRQPAMATPLAPGQPFARFGPGPRAALLLRLIAGLDFGHAAQALGVTPVAYEAALRQALAHPELDDARMQALREHLHEQIHQLPAERRLALAALRDKILGAQPLPAPAAPAPGLGPAAAGVLSRRWLWAALAGLLMLLAACFLWPLRALIAPGHSEPLPAELVAAPPSLSDTVIVTHPDYEQVANPADAQLARQLPLLSWLAAARIHVPSGGEPDPAPVAPTAFTDLSTDERALLSSAGATWPMLDPLTRAALQRNARAWITLGAGRRAAVREGLRRWNLQPATERARQRTPFLAWQRLSSAEQAQVRAAASQWQALPATEQQSLRAQFDVLPVDAQSMWWLGPGLGQEMLPIASLFAFMPESDRPALLAALRALDGPARANLALLAPRLSEARRQALRRELLLLPPEQRAALIRQRLLQ